MFVSAPIRSKEDMVSSYLISTQHGWSLRADVDAYLYENDRKSFRNLLEGIALGMYVGDGYPYVLHQAHHLLSTINGEARETIDAVAAACGLYTPTAKSLGKRNFAPGSAPDSLFSGEQLKG